MGKEGLRWKMSLSVQKQAMRDPLGLIWMHIYPSQFMYIGVDSCTHGLRQIKCIQTRRYLFFLFFFYKRVFRQLLVLPTYQNLRFLIWHRHQWCSRAPHRGQLQFTVIQQHGSSSPTVFRAHESARMIMWDVRSVQQCRVAEPLLQCRLGDRFYPHQLCILVSLMERM